MPKEKKVAFSKECQIFSGKRADDSWNPSWRPDIKTQNQAEARNKAKDQERADRRDRVDRGNSHATENILRSQCEKEIKDNPGLKSFILRKYSKLGG